MILKKKKSRRRTSKEQKQTVGTLEDFNVIQSNFGQNLSQERWMQFNFKHWKTERLSKGSALNQSKASKKNCQRYSIKILGKQKPTTPRPPATYTMTLNCQMYLKKLLKRFYLAPITVKSLENFSGAKMTFWLFL